MPMFNIEQLTLDKLPKDKVSKRIKLMHYTQTLNVNEIGKKIIDAGGNPAEAQVIFSNDCVWAVVTALETDEEHLKRYAKIMYDAKMFHAELERILKNFEAPP